MIDRVQIAIFVICLACPSLSLFIEDAKSAQDNTLIGSICEYSEENERERVHQILFSDDGREVWGLAGSNLLRGSDRQRAIIIRPEDNAVNYLPEKHSSAIVVLDVVFAGDGTIWVAMSSDEDKTLNVQYRKVGEKDLSESFFKSDENILKFWASKDRNEIWMGAEPGLYRLKLTTRSLSFYTDLEWNDSSEVKRNRYFTLPKDYIGDLVIGSSNGKAICSWNGGLSVIDLANGKPKHFPVERGDVEQLVLSPNERQVWTWTTSDCVQCFDLELEKWTHFLDKGVVESVDTRSLLISDDSRFVWFAGIAGCGCFDSQEKAFRVFSGVECIIWRQLDGAPLVKSPDGKSVLFGNIRGIAIASIDGKQMRKVDLDIEFDRFMFTRSIKPVPGKKDEFICAIGGLYPTKDDGIYLLNTETDNLEKLFATRSPYISAMEFSPISELWIAFPGEIYRLDINNKKVIDKYSTLISSRTKGSIDDKNPR